MVRIDLKDGIEYDDGKLNEASKFEGMDEIVNIGFTTAGIYLELVTIVMGSNVRK